MIIKIERGCKKMKREKIELKASLKAQDYKEGQVIKPTCFIKEVVEVETKFGDKTIVKFDDGDSVFLNAESNNRLIDKLGNDDDMWLNKAVKLSCERDKTFNKLYLVITPIA